MGRSMSEVSVDRDIVTEKETPQGSPPSDEGFGDSTSLNLSEGRQSTSQSVSSAKDVLSAKEELSQEADKDDAACATVEGDVVLERNWCS